MLPTPKLTGYFSLCVCVYVCVREREREKERERERESEREGEREGKRESESYVTRACKKEGGGVHGPSLTVNPCEIS